MATLRYSGHVEFLRQMRAMGLEGLLGPIA
jgi:hypothetical protein